MAAALAGGPRNEVRDDGDSQPGGGEASRPPPQPPSPAAPSHRHRVAPLPRCTTGAAARTGADLDAGHLPGLAWPSLDHFFLAAGLGHRGDGSELEPDQLRSEE